jgi:hypothetical protein
MATHSNPLHALCELLDSAIDAMQLAGLDYVGAARRELECIDTLLQDELARWADAEGQRVREWASEMWHAYRNPNLTQRARGMINPARHIIRLVQHRLLRELGLRWPTDGYQLNLPLGHPQPIDLKSLPANMELPPFRARQIKTRAPGQPTRVTEYDDHGNITREYTIDENS